jgi:ATP-binding cassette, subfamily B, bacterial
MPRTSRHRFRAFAEAYRQRRLDDDSQGEVAKAGETKGVKGWLRPGRRRTYLRSYFAWLKPHRYAVAGVFGLAVITAGLQMVEPLFMRFIVDKVLLEQTLTNVQRIRLLNIAGAIFLTVVVFNNIIGAVKDYRQQLLNVRVILSLRRSLFDRLLHLPLSKLWEMKTGGILSRLTGDIETTTGLLQLAIISPSISVIRLVIAIGILLSLNWRLALMALAILPGIMVISLIFAKRVRPIYRSLRKDAEIIDGRVGETF